MHRSHAGVFLVMYRPNVVGNHDDVFGRVSPPESGGVAAALRKWRDSHHSAADGVVPKRPIFEMHFETSGSGTTPSAPLRMLRDFSLVAATPPNLGGDTLAESWPATS